MRMKLWRPVAWGPFAALPGSVPGLRAALQKVAMSAADVVVVLAAVAALAGLGWFFFGPRKATAAVLAGGVQRLEVTVKGGYSPEVIRVRQGVPVELTFDRQESGDCTSRVVFSDIQMSAALPAWRRTTVRLDPGKE